MIKVCKFGGTSMADGTTFLRMKNIVEKDPSRRYLVLSAPGKRFGGDSKITDLLYKTHASVLKTGRCGSFFEQVRQRFCCIVYTLALDLDIKKLLDETEREILERRKEAFTVSRGEYLTGRIAASLLNLPFIDPCDLIRFREGRLDTVRTYALAAAALEKTERAIIPGFYGADEKGDVATFSRGGSDITGAIIARAIHADLYENWTDVSGFLVCDPRIVDSPAPIRSLTYRELRELSYMGANVLHNESIFPVREAGIPVRICNTFRPEDGGTMILPEAGYRASGRVVTGIAGKKDFAVVHIEKSLISNEIGFARRILSVLEKYDVSFEHMPSGIDTMSFVIGEAGLRGGMLEKIMAEIGAAVAPDCVNIHREISLIAVVGHGMSKNIGVSARLFEAVARVGVNVRMIDMGSSELNIILGVDNADYERTLKAIYEEFFIR